MPLYGFPRDQARTLRGVAGSAKLRSLQDQRIEYGQPNGAIGKKQLNRFTLNATLATSDASKAATITDQYGPGINADVTVAITVYNLETSTGGVYVFSGASGAAGQAIWDSGTNYRITQMQC